MSNCFLTFWVDNWQTLIISIIASVIATGLVALLLVYLFRVPNFALHLDYIPQKTTGKGVSLPVLDVSIVNKKHFIGFGAGEVNFGLFVPVSFIIDKKLFLITIDGQKEWPVDTRGKDEFTIKNEKYFLYRGVVHMAVHPDSRTHFLRIAGSFIKGNRLKIYYYFETPYGRFPKFLKFGERIKTAVSGKLPYSEKILD